jgi:glycosyltransferase involved in cell wall biosynthesis
VSVIVVMPAYNAERHIAAVIARLRAVEARGELPLTQIFVVNDGSHDGTRGAVSALANGRVPVCLIDRARNGGYGAAMKDGIDAARANDPEIVATVHADGQYSPEALPALVASLRARELDLLQGSRIAGGSALAGGMPRYKYIANALLNRIENHTLRLKLTDYHSGYLLYGRRALTQLPFRALSDSFDFDLECIASARSRGLRVGEAPIPTHYGDEVSHLQPIAYGLRVLRVLWNYRRGQYAP